MIGYYINNDYIADSNGNVKSGLKSLDVLEYLTKETLEPAIVYDLDACFVLIMALALGIYIVTFSTQSNLAVVRWENTMSNRVY
jgi:hypothetical protein